MLSLHVSSQVGNHLTFCLPVRGITSFRPALPVRVDHWNAFYIFVSEGLALAYISLEVSSWLILVHQSLLNGVLAAIPVWSWFWMLQCTWFEVPFKEGTECIRLLLFDGGPSRRQLSELSVMLLLSGSSTKSPELGVWSNIVLKFFNCW